ncbi:MAG: AGE family epimerase/isomerase, partial [Oscillospiraceae bacterium]|nr:AGE family epimerase/isomerase [Oscillospiraceae bacterium]
LLYFWMPRCLDTENGGYLNCFTNDGSRLVSTDKYTWSQGRFLWMFSRLATMESDLFDEAQRAEFLRYAKSGRDFLLKYALVAPNDYRCVFLTDAEGNPKGLPGHEGYDLSISADCFVVMGFAAYTRAVNDPEGWDFAKKLADSVWERYQSDCYRSLPYPVTAAHIAHGRPMILTHLFCEMYRTAMQVEPAVAEGMLERIDKSNRAVFEQFADEHHLIHEFRAANGAFSENLFCQHINPGHTLEDMWFQLDACDLLKTDRYDCEISQIVKATMELGWDKEFGGLYHFIACDGLNTKYVPGEAAEEPQMSLILDDWGSKLWWVHSEALYITLLMYLRTGDTEFEKLFDKIFDYTYKTFPNPDRNIREWIQIRTREGKPQEKVVALPVKDPYHIIRNVMLIIEALEVSL